MIAPERLYHFLQEKGVSFYAGVPDSLLKEFLKFIQDQAAAADHIITANEGLAIGLASGYHFSTGKLPLVYLQNSGLGNIINPLTSLADKEMYAVPMLLLIGWRGRPGIKDEPQHKKMGRITIPLLDTLEVPVYLLDTDASSSFEKISRAIDEATMQQKPVALLAPENIFEKYEGRPEENNYALVREEVIRKIIIHLAGDEVVVCTTGKTSREFYEQNELAGRKIKKYLLSVGAMGHASHIALGMSLHSREKIVMLDGDGAVLMQMGSLPVIGNIVQGSFVHVVLNNGSHESVGAQPTQGFAADLCSVAKACGYSSAVLITNQDELTDWLKNLSSVSGKQFAEIRINNFSRKDLGRPKGEPREWKNEFMNSTKN